MTTETTTQEDYSDDTKLNIYKCFCVTLKYMDDSGIFDPDHLKSIQECMIIFWQKELTEAQRAAMWEEDRNMGIKALIDNIKES